MLSEGELHVQAMRLVCEALADREKTGLEVDWDVINQQLDHMDVILQGITDQRNDDAEEIQILKKEREAAYEKLSTLRDEVAAEIESLRKDRDHWKTARQEAIEAGELMQAEIETLRQQLAAARAETVEVRRRLAEEINRHNATHCEKIELFPKVEWANQHNAELIGERDAALATVDLQRAGIELLNAFVGKVRSVMDRQYDGVEFDDLSRALAELDAGTSEPEGEK